MATLSNSAQYTRNFVKYLLIFIALALIITFIAKLINDQIQLVQESNIVATKGYGKLPDMKLIKGLELLSDSTPTYDLQTTNGRLYIEDSKSYKFENVPTVVYVYKYYANQPSLYLNQEIKDLGGIIGYKTVPEDQNTFMRWYSSTGFRILEITKLSKDVQIRTDISKDNSFDTIKDFSAGFQKYQTQLYSFLASRKMTNSNYTDRSYVSEFNSEFVIWNADKGVFERTDSASRAEFARINLSKTVVANYVRIPSNINGTEKVAQYLLPRQIISTVRTDSPRVSSINAIVGPKPEDIYFLTLSGVEYDLSNFESYEIITITEAYSKLINNEGILVDLRRNARNDDYLYTPESVKTFHVQKIHLDYYEPQFRAQGYLQPIYVFRGFADLTDGSTAEFTFYLPAIKN